MEECKACKHEENHEHEEESIKGEQPYRIKRYKDKWIVTGTLPEGYVGGVFEIVINAETSQVESLIHGE